MNGVHHLEQKTTLNAGVLQPPTAVSSVSNFPHAPLKQCVARPSKWNNKPKNSKKKETKKQAGIINPCEKDGTSEKTLKIKLILSISKTPKILLRDSPFLGCHPKWAESLPALAPAFHATFLSQGPPACCPLTGWLEI